MKLLTIKIVTRSSLDCLKGGGRKDTHLFPLPPPRSYLLLIVHFLYLNDNFPVFRYTLQTQIQVIKIPQVSLNHIKTEHIMIM